jgi:hypothetical protein
MKYKVEFDFSEVNGEDAKHCIMVDDDGNELKFKTKKEAKRIFDERGIGYFDGSNKYVTPPYKIIEVRT